MGQVDRQLIPLPELLNDLMIERQHCDAEVSPALVTSTPLLLGLCRPPEELLGVVYRDGEADAGADLHAVDSNRLAVQVDQRPPGVAEGDGGVSLDVLGDVLAPEPQLIRRPGDVAHHSYGQGG